LIMTQLTDQERTAQMNDMRSFDEQMPCVGVFWYDLAGHGFYGVRKKEITPVMVEEAAKKGSPFISYPQMQGELSVDDSSLGGRVVWSIDKFIVLVGKWAEPIQEIFRNYWRRNSHYRISSSCMTSTGI